MPSARLPQISVIFYNDTTLCRSRDPTRTFEISAVYVPVEPADPFVEAIRTAQEIGARDRFRRSRFHRAPARARHLSRFVRAAHRSRSRSMWKPIASIRSSARAEIEQFAAGDRLEAAGRRPARAA